MPTLSAMPITEEVTLRGGAVMRVLEHADRDHLRTRLRFMDVGGEVMGRVAHLSAERMDIRLDAGDTVEASSNGNRHCAVAFEVEGQPFCFSSVLLGVAGSVVTLRRPTELSTKQRRRFWRARLRESAVVEIARLDGSFRGEADILNLSPAGMACRVTASEAGRLATGDPLAVTLALGGDGPWRLRARLRAKTPASESDCVILRLQFDVESMSTNLHEQLRLLVKNPGRSS